MSSKIRNDGNDSKYFENRITIKFIPLCNFRIVIEVLIEVNQFLPDDLPNVIKMSQCNDLNV